MPIAASVTTSALPPSEMNGSGRPVIGSSPTTPPMLIIAWPTSQVVIAGGDEPAERVVDPAGDPQPGVRQHREQRQHHQAADHAELLGDDGEDEVVVRRRAASPT